jgi:hypothetical protein
VPDLVGLSTAGLLNAADTWAAAGFTGPLTKHVNETGDWIVLSQSLAVGSSQPCTSSITVHNHL